MGALLTCGDNKESNFSKCTMGIRRVLHLAGVGAIVGKLYFFDYDGGITAHDITGPRNALPEQAVRRRIRFLVVIENLQVKYEE